MGEWTFAFIDLAGFTAMTDAHGDEEAADLISRFVDLTKQSLGSDDRLVKNIGDAVMVVSPTPVSAVAMCQGLFQALAAEPNFPLPRAGIHHGTAAERDGDFFGSAVNLAARVAGQAHEGQVLVTDAVLQGIGSLALPSHDHGVFRLRNLPGEISLYKVEVLPSTEGAVVDPVCRMRVDPEAAAGRLRYGSSDYWFCSLKCAAAFAENPGRHLR